MTYSLWRYSIALLLIKELLSQQMKCRDRPMLMGFTILIMFLTILNLTEC